ncbi:Pentatricopeptide repeat superfamily protein [Prunus dulcis]|uniref:Pentatricopeptide repeat superfamily protein n=1 Tax=Prunus dulcis TaxID=3755 RepID=A0A4Y1RAN5_PRUDU|nr:Pentatricopeptide repeat superfamily protein [Prunus dulcis]
MKLPSTNSFFCSRFCPPFVAKVSSAQRRCPFSVRFQPAGWGVAMEDLHSLLAMRGGRQFWFGRCAANPAALLDFVSQICGREISHPFYSLRLRLPSFLVANFCILYLQVLGRGIGSHRLAQVDISFTGQLQKLKAEPAHKTSPRPLSRVMLRLIDNFDELELYDTQGQSCRNYLRSQLRCLSHWLRALVKTVPTKIMSNSLMNLGFKPLSESRKLMHKQAMEKLVDQKHIKHILPGKWQARVRELKCASLHFELSN